MIPLLFFAPPIPPAERVLVVLGTVLVILGIVVCSIGGSLRESLSNPLLLSAVRVIGGPCSRFSQNSLRCG